MSCGDFPTSSVARMSGVPLVMVHGGSCAITCQPLHLILNGVKLAARTGYQVLLKTHCVVTAVEAAVNVLEEDPTFNAGRGSALNAAGKVECGASIMEGTKMVSGSVAVTDCVVTPISLARKVMEASDCCFIAGEGVRQFAETVGMTTVNGEELITPHMRAAYEQFKKNKLIKQNPSLGCMDTVGAVVVDWQGRVASGCSTGGRLGKMVGRIGDAPIPGSGSFCDDNIGAVSCTGHGESVIYHNLSHRILTNMKIGMSAEDATVRELCCFGRKYKEGAGAISVNNRGDVGVGFTTDNFAWACQQGNELHYGYEPGQHIVELLPHHSC